MLITAAEVIREVLPNKNMDENLLIDSIKIAELKYLKKVLHADFYNQLVNENDQQYFTGLNKTLLVDFVKPALARYVVYEALPMIKTEITSNGLQIPDIDFNQPADRENYAHLRNKFLSDAELLLDEMKNYISENLSSFPLYNSTSNISEKTLPFIY